MIVRELIAKLGLRVDNKGFKKGDKSIDKTLGGLKKLAGALAGGFVVKAFAGFINNQINLADNIGKTATQLGVGIEKLQEFRFAADLAGVESAKFDQGLALLQKNAKDAADGSAEFADDFNRLGINVKDVNGELKDGPTLLLNMADGIAALDNESEKVALSLSLMGRSGRTLLPLFTDGAEGIRRMQEDARDLGFVLGEDAVRAAEFAKDEFTRFGRVVLGLKQKVFLAILPSITAFTGKLIEGGKRFKKFTDQSNLVKAALIVLGGIAVAAGIKMLIAFAGPLLIAIALAAAFGVLALAVDEVITLFSGGRTVIGDFIDEIFGLGTADQFVQNHRAGVDIMAEAWRNAEGDVVSFASSLFGLQISIKDVGDVFRDLGALWFDVTKELKALTLDAIAVMLEGFAKIPGAGKLFSGAAKFARDQAADVRLGVRQTQGRGIGAPIEIRGRARRDATIQRSQDRRNRSEARRTARAAGLAVEGLTVSRGGRGTLGDPGEARGRTIGRGTGATEELTRFGVARAATAERRQAIELNQDNRNTITLTGNPEQQVEQLQRMIKERDDSNNRKAAQALDRTGGS